MKLVLPFTSAMLNGPSHKLSNFSCLHISSLLASYFKTISPCLQSLSLAFLSNKLFILFWYWRILCWTSSLSWFSSMIWLILLEKSSASSYDSCKNFMTRNASYVGEIASVPYTSWKGDFQVDLLGDTLFSQTAYLRWLSQLLFWSTNTFLITLTRLLFNDSSNPLPCG